MVGTTKVTIPPGLPAPQSGIFLLYTTNVKDKNLPKIVVVRQEFQKLYGWPPILESTSKKLPKINPALVWLATHTAVGNLVARQRSSPLTGVTRVE